MAVASLRSPAVVYREEQTFAWWAYALASSATVGIWVALSFGLGDGPIRDAGPSRLLMAALLSLSGLSVPALVTVGLLKMTTEVTPSDLRVWFGWVPTYRRVVPLGDVQRVEVVTYRPLADYGGWGIRAGRDGDRALSARGNRGVRLELADGTRLLIGSQRPEVLARAIENALRPGP